jgi:uncharacterized protein YndB with AHSA1/START domain
MPDIMHLVKINVSPERVYQALTTAEGTLAAKGSEAQR